MDHPTRRRVGLRARIACWLLSAFTLAAVPTAATAQNILSVPFTNGFIGTVGSNPQDARSVITFATLGISRIFFIQNSSTTQFEQLQGNDIGGTVRLVGTNGVTLDLPASAVWRQNSGGTTMLIGFIPKNASPVNWNYGGSSTLTITGGGAGGASDIGGYLADYAGPYATDGSNQNGNAATSNVLASLNTYLATVVSSRPAGPVTVNTLSTSDNTPSITGAATLGAGETLTVVVNGVQYSTSSSPAIQVSGSNWTLTLTTPLAGGTYEVAATITNADGFTLSDTSTNELTIAAAVTISGTFTASDKVYTGTTAATGNTTGLTLVGVANGHTVTIASVTLAFGTASVGGGKTVSIVGVTLGGTHGSSYAVDLTGAPTAAAAITTRELTISGLSAQNKVYDGSVSATLTGTAAYAGLQNGESFVVSGTPSATFATPEVGTAIGVSVSGYVAPSSNYTVAQPSSLTANITKKTLGMTNGFVANDKTYDGSTIATYASHDLALTGSESGDDVSIGSFTVAFETAGVGQNKTVRISALTLTGDDAGNYQVNLATAPTSTANITTSGATVTISGSFTANDKLYSGTRTATGATGSLTLAGVANGDEVSIASVVLAFLSTGVGDERTVEITGVTLQGADAGSYAVDLTGAPTATADITPKALTIGGSFTASDKTFDGNTTASIASNALTLVGIIGDDVVTLSNVSAAFGTAAPGNDKIVSLNSSANLQGAAAGNYSISYVDAPTTTADITTAGGVLTISGSFTANNKVYDATVAATGNTSGLMLAGVVGGDTVAIATVSLAFQSAGVGGGKTVVITGLTLEGAQASEYTFTLTDAPTSTASITPRPVAIGGSFSAADKLYDGTRSATLGTNALTVVGVAGSDVLTLADVAIEFAEELVGNRRVLIASAALRGARAGNYQLSLAAAPTASANILALEPPSAPRALQGTPADGRVTVAFQLPAVEGCRPVSSVIVEHSADNGATWTRRTFETRSASPVELAPLTNNVTYRVRVAAANECGMGPWAEIGGLTPLAPVREGDGTIRRNDPGTTTVTRNGTPVDVDMSVVEDTIVKITSPDFTLSVRSADTTGAPVQPNGLTLQLEQGGSAFTAGSGFGPGSWVTIYIYDASGAPRFLGKVLVGTNGAFATVFPVPNDLVAGGHTLQVNGVDNTQQPRSTTIGVEVVEPPADVALLAVPDRTEMAEGDTVTFTLSVTNNGRGAALNVVIPRAFDEPGFRFVAATPIHGTFDATTLTWTIPRIDAGGTARLTLRAIVLPPTPAVSLTHVGGSVR